MPTSIEPFTSGSPVSIPPLRTSSRSAPASAHDLPRDRANRAGGFAGGDFLVALAADDHDFVARRDVEARDVDHDHVHANRAHDRHPAAAHEHRSAIGEPRVQSVGVTRGHDGDRSRRVRRPPQTVAGAFARPHALDRHDTAGQ